MFSSCCPEWIRLVEQSKPKYIKNLSSAKSLQQIFGAASKNYYPYIENLDPKSIFTVSIMPCVAKKFKSERDEINTNGIRDIDALLTTKELADLIKTFIKEKVDYKEIRGNALYSQNKASIFRKSHKNPSVIFMYKNYLNKDKNLHHSLFHPTYFNRKK